MIKEQLNSRLIRRSGAIYPEGATTLAHWCPGCDNFHDYAVETPMSNGARWQWDGNAARPSFRPSMHIKIGPTGSGKMYVCHYYLRDGKLEFLSDCTHKFAGQTVNLPDIPREQLIYLGVGS